MGRERLVGRLRSPNDEMVAPELSSGEPLLGSDDMSDGPIDVSPRDRFGALLAWDKRVSAKFYRWYREEPRAPHSLLLILEASGHGVAWIIWPVIVFLLHPNMPAARLSTLIHFYAFTFLDLATIGILKPIFHRPRPEYNSGLYIATIEAVDQFSFPSGHATRGFGVAAFVLYVALTRPGSMAHWLESSLFLVFVCHWALAVAASRVALGRHHFLDVAVGALLGVVYISILHAFWIPDAVIADFRDSCLLKKSVVRYAFRASKARNCTLG